MFLALLELVRLQAIQLRQNRLFGEILVRKHQNFDALLAETTSSARDDWR
jgi:segregation and condensation protein A